VYEYQIPHSFDAANPAVKFTVADYPEPYRSSERPELPIHLIPKSLDASRPLIYPQPALEAYFRSKDCPTSLDGYLVPNTPLLHVHIAVFDDLTLIGVTSSHITFDALGTGTVLHAWTRLLNGDGLETIQGMEWDAAPFDSFMGPTTVPCQRGWFDLGLCSQILFIVRFVMGLLWDSKEVAYIVRMPKIFLADSKREIMEDLQRQGSGEWIGSSDVLMAWWFKVCLYCIGFSLISHRHRPSIATAGSMTVRRFTSTFL
jgi:hypothetical protein